MLSALTNVSGSCLRAFESVPAARAEEERHTRCRLPHTRPGPKPTGTARLGFRNVPVRPLADSCFDSPSIVNLIYGQIRDTSGSERGHNAGECRRIHIHQI